MKKKTRSSKSHVAINDEERSLFLEAMGETLRVEPEDRQVPQLPSTKKETNLADVDRELFLRAFESGFTTTSTELIENENSIKPKPLATKRNKSDIEASLDLHGLNREQAYVRLKLFIERCLSLHKRRVLIIHGKGSGILRQEVRRLLGENDRVALISDAPTRLGGEGAVVVELKKSK